MKIIITGGAGFIGSNIARALLRREDVEKVTVLDNLLTGNIENLADILDDHRLEFVEGDIRNMDTCLKVFSGGDAICHQAALGSVPRSIKNPVLTNDHNITGTLNVFTAARDLDIKRVVYASSSSVYGDEANMPKVESRVGRPLSPYAVTKKVSELYADNFGALYDMEMFGLRYFNIFGPYQSPKGAYAAVIPLFVQAALSGQPATINGDGSFSRDFTYVDNAVQANINALFSKESTAYNQVYNVACGYRTNLNELWAMINTVLGTNIEVQYGPERPGDIPHSLADISKAETLLDYSPSVDIETGLKLTVAYLKNYFSKVN
ncbi:SDR family oxidoreductase [Membranihabitans marinus]|uniref:SDR family oxidoreductase n=1 Tax=Membranihabitans marinus TaxID=1227546 RepID=UPI001F26B8B4|nr:SDR family oxidoreductase [Membranihabitans marinus]